jgi:hypothetical protein
MKLTKVPPDSRRIDDKTLAELAAIVREWQALLDTSDPASLPPDDAVDSLLQHLGDSGPVDDFEAGRRRERRRYPREGTGQR